MADLDDLLATLDARVQGALDDVAAELQASARAGAPGRSGRLRRSIQVDRVSRVERAVGSPLPYAAIIEERTGFMAGAVRAVESRIPAIFAEALS
jgi:hypothetical protein